MQVSCGSGTVLLLGTNPTSCLSEGFCPHAFEGCGLTTVPAHSLNRLQRLFYLDLSRNQIANVADGALTNLTQLVYLDFSHNHIEALPACIGDLTQLIYLDLSHNKLKVVPEYIGNLTQLTTLYLSYNKLEALPGSFTE